MFEKARSRNFCGGIALSKSPGTKNKNKAWMRLIKYGFPWKKDRITRGRVPIIEILECD